MKREQIARQAGLLHEMSHEISGLTFSDVQFWIPDEGVFQCISQTVDQSRLQLGTEIVGRFNRSLICSQRDLMSIRIECCDVNGD
ncbi:MAG: hypothetical protein A2061_10035 [Gallionellales bacterium GWA2_59_43]|nr:MAG: hypothetical protein A2061_10035 [Gallionellales bacterium GWA2_59_43]